MANRQKLELTWVGKDERPRLEPRILLEDPARSHHSENNVSGNDIFDNRLIFGDNLLALKALEQEFAGKIKCVYIDPPFNTGQAFAHYDDGIEHSLWLSLMRDRLELLIRLLTPDGSLWVHCDDSEQAYCKIVLDELLGRENFVTTFIWRKVDSPNDNKVPVTPDHEYILCYSRNPEATTFRQKEDASILDAFRSQDHTGRFYRDRLLKKNGKNSLRADRPSMFFPITGPDGIEVLPIHEDGREACWAVGEAAVRRMLSANEVVWKDRGAAGRCKWVPYTREYAPESPRRPWPTIWTDVQSTRQAKAHQKALLPAVPVFETPKPEPLLARILTIATQPGDLVLDSFAGSGTTGAVAHKMGRRWIMIELGEHAHTHIIPRLTKVIDGDDPGGITQAVDWKGGGGFRYYHLAPSLLEKDRWGNWVVSKEYNAEMLSEAMCKHEGFTFNPSPDLYWQHGQSTEQDFIYVTTQTLTSAQLDALSEDVGEERTLLVCCGAWRGNANKWNNLTLKKIPAVVLGRCEWGRDDYSLAVAELPSAPAAADIVDIEAGTVAAPTRRRGRPRGSAAATPTLFGDETEP